MYEAHEAATAFPMIAGKEFGELVDDIRSKGLLHPIVMIKVDEDVWQILDGRNRYAACQEAGVEPRYSYYEGDDPIGYVISANLTRRNLTEWQALEAAALLSKLSKGRRNKSADLADLTQRDIAEKFKVNERDMRRVKAIKENAEPEVLEAAQSDEISVRKADEIARLERQQQLDALNDIRNNVPKKREYDPKVSKAERISDEELLGLSALHKYGKGSPSSSVRTGALALRRIVPAVEE